MFLEVSEETFKDKVEVLPSPIKDTIKPKSLMYTELSRKHSKNNTHKSSRPLSKKN